MLENLIEMLLPTFYLRWKYPLSKLSYNLSLKLKSLVEKRPLCIPSTQDDCRCPRSGGDPGAKVPPMLQEERRNRGISGTRPACQSEHQRRYVHPSHIPGSVLLQPIFLGPTLRLLQVNPMICVWPPVRLSPEPRYEALKASPGKKLARCSAVVTAVHSHYYWC